MQQLTSRQKNKDCKYCGGLIYFSMLGTPINTAAKTRHTCEGYYKAKSYKFLGRDDLSEEELFQYEAAVNA